MTKVIGTNKVLSNLKKFADLSRDAIEKGVWLTANEVKSNTQIAIQTRSMGESQIRTSQGGKKYTVITSKPGDAPNTDTGTLVQSIAVEHKGTKAFVGTNVKYAEFLELGTRDMKARPFLIPALEKASQNGSLAKNIKAVAKAIA